jgi:hypothetical protein
MTDPVAAAKVRYPTPLLIGLGFGIHHLIHFLSDLKNEISPSTCCRDLDLELGRRLMGSRGP